ncbi:succinic semialdehyde dehydrogenase [Smaragdicoccus niigatensis]|uniref:succinic semialdehyde dehydrogenase n=1 Tax=Smaragdicoccus niigatensis TaxID=359359 RepID=UPI00036DE708|nr:succinic semialdehyde dehydrogenase [Smaragdicoccus niigatensis]
MKASTAAALASTVTGRGDPAHIKRPFTDEPLAWIPQMTAEDINDALDRARAAQKGWAQVSAKQRARTIGRVLDLVHRDRELFMDVLQAEGGKARVDALIELGEALLAVRHHVNTAEALLADESHSGIIPGLTSTSVIHRPHGVVGVIVPWNFPVALGAADALPALIAGNAVLLKADNQTALSLLLLRRCALEAGVPADVFGVVVGHRNDIGAALLDGVDYVAFTGSTASGREIAQHAGRRLIGCSLELGGKNPMIVLPDADLDRAASSLARTSFANSGQLCMTAERIYAHVDIYERFIDLAVRHTAEIQLGADYSFGTDMGSITTDANFARLGEYIGQATSVGAEVLTGGRPRPDIGPKFFEPTILAGVTPRARLHAEEVFGPVVSIYPFRTIDEAVAAANDSQYGLSASIWTRDTSAGRKLAPRIEAGGVNVNDGYAAAFGTHSAPAGGMKGSGVGRRHGAAGLLRYTEAQTVAVQRLTSLNSRMGLPRELHGELTGQLLGWLKHIS